MKKKPDYLPDAKSKKSAGLIFLIFVTAGLIYFAASPALNRHSEAEKKDPAIETVRLDENWWETRRLIYHGIPARCVLKLTGISISSPDETISSVWQTFDRIGEIFNPFDPNSEIYHLNEAPQTTSVPVSDDMFTVLSVSKRIWQDTNGFFDPSMWQLKQLWQKAEKNQQIPSEQDIVDALKWTGFDRVRLLNKNNNVVEYSGHPVKLDLGAIVKGFAVDQVRKMLLECGVTAGLVQLGGEICTFGDNNGNPWRIGIQHPREMNKIWGVITAKNHLRVSTSGNYRQPIRIAGKSFYHIFSPETGRPVSEKVLGVTTASVDGGHSSAWLDGVATAITVMGAQKGLALAEKLGFEALILYEEKGGSIGEFVTPGLSEYYEGPDTSE